MIEGLRTRGQWGVLDEQLDDSPDELDLLVDHITEYVRRIAEAINSRWSSTASDVVEDVSPA